MTHLTWHEEWENQSLLFSLPPFLLISECIVSLLWLKPKPQHPINYFTRIRIKPTVSGGEEQGEEGQRSGVSLSVLEAASGFQAQVLGHVVFSINAYFFSSKTLSVRSLAWPAFLTLLPRFPPPATQAAISTKKCLFLLFIFIFSPLSHVFLFAV